MRKLRCALFGHDWWPISQPKALGMVSEAECACRRCGERSTVQMVLTGQLFRRWEQRHA